ncbi:MAG: hypothetical protein AABX65_04155 [Nanoarchaeota archaeon]
MEPLEITGTENLNEEENQIVRDITEKYHQKFQKLFSEMISIKLLIKTYHPHEKHKEKKEYSIKAELFTKNRIAESDCTGWNLSSALHESFEKLKHQLEHRH